MSRFQAIRSSLFGSKTTEESAPDERLQELLDVMPWEEDDRKNFDEAALYKYVKKHPKSLRAKYPYEKGQGHYPLFRIIALGSSLKTVQKVHQLFPDAMTSTSPYSRANPLHVACIYAAPFDVIQYILRHIPNAIRQTNKHVFLPLHMACQADIPAAASLPVMQLLVQAYPEALFKRTKLGGPPLRIAERNSQSRPEVIAYLKEQEEAHRDLDTSNGPSLATSSSIESSEFLHRTTAPV